MKKISLILALTLLTIVTDAQIRIKVGLTGGVPSGDMKTYYNGVAGAEASVLYFITDRLGIGIEGGFLHFFNKDWDEPYYSTYYSDVNFRCIPIRALIEYYLLDAPLKPLIGVEFGNYSTTLSYTVTWYDYYYGRLHDTYENSADRFGFAPFIGFDLDLGKVVAIECIAKYTSVNDIDANSPRQVLKYIGANVGIVIKF